MTISRPVLAALTLTIPVLAGCQFSFSAGGPDYEKLETTMADELNTQYEAISQRVSGVRCPRPDETPKTGDSITCVADLDGSDVRVEATFTSDDYDVDFATIDTVYDLGDTADGLADDRVIVCPLHNHTFDLCTGREVSGVDLAVPSYAVEAVDGTIRVTPN